MDMAQEKMEEDWEVASTSIPTNGSILTRSNHVPMINGLGDNCPVLQGDNLRTRRNNMVLLNQHGLLYTPPTRTSPCRLYQIKQEERMDLSSREMMHERELHTSMQLCHALETSLKMNDNNWEKPSVVRGIDLISESPASSLTMKSQKAYKHH
ncbi:P2R1A-PPP2R2A-interacting phosphatase regulator 1-like [Dipodomys merriami]|uniref:P2R1A-PPP2R2A-interacting phosphatase regulator 1-like n=1 Tax=Dipodomys merriami TaxID=94247 RepID=UPI003855CB25